MLNFIVKMITDRYSKEEIAQRLNLNLPDYEKLYEEIYTKEPIASTEGKLKTIQNRNKIFKCGGEKFVLTLYDDAIKVNAALSFLEKLLLKIKQFFQKIVNKILEFIINIKNKIMNAIIEFLKKLLPDSEKFAFLEYIIIFLNFVFTLLMIPVMIITLIMNFINNVLNFINKFSLGGILGFIIGVLLGILLSLIMLVLDFIGLIIALLLAPFIEKFINKMFEKEIIKRILIGKIINDNIINEEMIIPLNYLKVVKTSDQKSIFGMSKCIVTKYKIETAPKVTIKDILIFLFLSSDYFVNKYEYFLLKDQQFAQELLNRLQK